VNLETYPDLGPGRHPTARGARSGSDGRLDLLALDGPIPWDGGQVPAALAEALASVQGNILRPHARRVGLHVFLRLRGAPARTWLATMANDLTSAVDELEPGRAQRGAVFRSLALSARGYAAAGLDPSLWPGQTGDVFRAGMSQRGPGLGDRPRRMWESRYRDGSDALLVLAHDDEAAAMAVFRELFAGAPTAGVDVLGVEIGRRLTNEYGESIEHFGYVDGRSQPRFLTVDVIRDQRQNRLDDWSPAFPPSQVLVSCPGSGGRSFGSYLVFRKLEQDLRAFRRLEIRRARELGLTAADRVLAGPALIGRLEDGRPVGLLDELPSPMPVENGFRYDQTPPACPVGSHVRNVNPRTGASRARVIARRGMPYGKGNGGRPLGDLEPEQLPTGDCGLLFMAFMADIESQFEVIQRAANGGDHGRRPDPLIGRPALAGGATSGASSYANGPSASGPADSDAAVRLLGGDYFFVPSIDLFRGLDGASADVARRRPASARASVGRSSSTTASSYLG
jgi:Dyp-type peroxidase family